jgi:hypothetical protein
MKLASMVMVATIAGAGIASAQSLPPITKSKAAATRAAGATNEHTRRMTESQDSAGPAAKSPREGVAHATQASAGSTPAPETMSSLARESFRYARDGRRDPFVSLMAYGELRPLITELRVTSIAFDPNGGSVAVLRDLGTKEQYRVRVGESLGRMRVARINKKDITFTIEEFGFSRQESLSLVDPKKESSQ